MRNRRINRDELIWHAVAAIPFGMVATYGQIAEWAGLPRQARQVGYALHNLPADSTVPWHRVINAKGMIAFPPGSAQYYRQRELLNSEGVLFVGQRIDMRRFRWKPTMDEAVWGVP
ncbi:MAG: MGMT family protein [Gammaproteobacteria bacterium]|nr:MGMT family protein [Gammaproteobacteria bacterium]